jgi:predicted nucleic acid-binding protein
VIVVDASALVEFLLRTSAGKTGETWLLRSRQTLHVPHLLDVAVTQIVRRYAATGAIAAERGQEAIADLADMAMQRYPHDFLLPRVWALRNTLSAYDAIYVALAEALEIPLLTRDRRLAAAPGHHARIELL